MADAAPKKGMGFIKAALGGGVGLATGVIGVYATAVVDKIAKPPKPLANFSIEPPQGLNVTIQNQSSGQSGWWDFGDGTALEPFNPDEKTVAHTYAKPGNYSVKLQVRNFLNEDHERSVNVDVSTPAPNSSGGPTIASLTVEPIAGTVAPAMFRVKCETKNVKQIMMFSGNPAQKPELLPTNGSFVKELLFETPGRFGVQLFGINGEAVDMKYNIVNVEAPRPGVISAIAKVSDSGSRLERKASLVSTTIRVPEKPTGTFERIVLPESGFQFGETKLEAVANKAVKNVKVELALDKKSAKVTGEWVGDVRAAGGADVMIRFNSTLEKPVAIAPTTRNIAGQLVFTGDIFKNDLFNGPLEATLPLPAPAPGATALNRQVVLELHEMGQKDMVILPASELTKPTGETTVKLSNGSERTLRWDLDTKANTLKVSIRPQAGGNRVASR
jgi:PKD domain